MMAPEEKDQLQMGIFQHANRLDREEQYLQGRTTAAKKKKKIEVHVSEYCDSGTLNCGVKLTDENRRSYGGFQVCIDCERRLTERDHKE